MSIKKFKPWQKVPIEYMTQNCVNNGGIFLFHYMGTGKSLSAMGIIHNLGLPYLIICPEPLINQWKENYIKVYKKKLPVNIGVISFEQAGNFLKDKGSDWFSKTTLVMDEAHNYSKYIKSISIKKLQLFKKRILLSATPIYNSAGDLSYIVNTVAGHNVFPIDPKVFEERYYKVYTTKSLWFGWVYNSLNMLKSIVGYTVVPGLAGVLLLGIKQMSYAYEISKTTSEKGIFYLTRNEMDISFVEIHRNIVFRIMDGMTKSISIFINSIANPIFKLVSLISNIINSNSILKDVTSLDSLVDKINLKKYSINASILRLFKENQKTLKTLIYGKTDLHKLNIKDIDRHWIEICRVCIGITLIIFLYSIITIICIILKRKFSDAKFNKGKETYSEPNFDKIQKEIGPYISYFSPDKQNNDFPKVKEIQNYVSLNSEQILVLMKYTIAKLTFEDYLSLGIFQNFTECDELVFDQKNYNLFLEYGRFVGNICYFKNKDELNEYILDKILSYNERSYRCQLNKGYSFKLVTPKYIEIKKYRDKYPDKRIVIYTSSSIAAKTLSTYLTSQNIYNQLLLNSCHNDDFKKIIKKYYQRKSILILDSSYYEGISILNTDTMFMLEPINNIAQNLQAKARIVRLDSHSPGSSVEIIELISTMNIISQHLGSFRSWFQTSRYVMYPHLYNEHNPHVTPDMIIYNKIKRLTAENNGLIDILKKTAIEYTIPPESCLSLECKIGELNESSNCGKVISNLVKKDLIKMSLSKTLKNNSQKSLKKKDRKSSKKSISKK